MGDAGAAARIRGFDGIRAIAVLFVFAAHRLHLEATDHLGFWGVSTFFCLSGYLITSILHRYRLETESAGPNPNRQLGRFLLRRTIRIFPIYYLTLCVVTALTLFAPGFERLGQGLGFHFLYLSNWYVSVVRGEWIGHLSHLWSLAAEEQFYLLFAPLLLFTPGRSHLAICWSFVLVGALSLLLLLFLRVTDVVLFTFPLISFGLLGVGGLAALDGDRWLKSGKVRSALWLCGALAVAAILQPVLGAPRLLPRGMEFPVVAIAGAALLLGLHHGIWEWPRRLLEFPALRWVGRRSYAIYLYNFIYSWPVMVLLQSRLGFGLSPIVLFLLQTALDLAILLALAGISWALIERPLLKLKSKSGSDFAALRAATPT